MILLAALCVPAAQATQIFSVSGVNVSQGAFNAEADFSYGVDTVTITFTNKIVDQTTVGQDIAGIAWSFSSGSFANNVGTATHLTTTERSGIQQGVAGGWTDVAYNSNTALWLNPTNTGLNFNFTTIGNTAGRYTIVGAPGTGNTYHNAVSSLDNHDPLLAVTAVFTLHIPGVVADSVDGNSVVFAFGTDPDFTAPVCVTNCGGGGQLDVPEPTSYLLVAGGLGLLGLLRRRLI
jgi:hypothetical protein